MAEETATPFPVRIPKMPASNGTNIHSLLLTIVLALSGWTLATVSGQNRDNATAQVNIQTNARDILDLRARITVAEAAVQQTKMQVAVLEAKMSMNPAKVSN